MSEVPVGAIKLMRKRSVCFRGGGCTEDVELRVVDAGQAGDGEEICAREVEFGGPGDNNQGECCDNAQFQEEQEPRIGFGTQR